MDKKISFIGCGNMGQAILKGLLNSGQVKAENVWVYTPSPGKVQQLCASLGVNQAQSAQEAAQAGDIVIGAVKPGIMLRVMSEIASNLNKDSLVVSVAAGITLSQLATVLGHDRKIIRAMSNTPALIGAGMTSLTPNALVDADDLHEIVEMFRSFGCAEVVDESLIHAVVGISGSAPAYIFMLIEAMADAGVLGGMPRDQAYRFVAQAVAGSAQMVQQTNMHPAALKDMVCSPAGTTIEAVKVLEEKGLRAAVVSAIAACMARSEQLSK